MNHWQMITLAYGLTFAALTLEVVLLFRRRRQALRQALDGLDAADEPASGIAKAGVRGNAGAAP
jgi:hypothetical protein